MIRANLLSFLVLLLFLDVRRRVSSSRRSHFSVNLFDLASARRGIHGFRRSIVDPSGLKRKPRQRHRAFPDGAFST